MEQCARGTAKLTRSPENRHNCERVDFAQTVQRSLKETKQLREVKSVQYVFLLVQTRNSTQL